MADLSKVPLVALSIDTKILISTLLNPTKWLPTDDGIPRDWRGFAHLCGMDGEKVPSLASHMDPIGQLFTFVESKHFSVKDFESILTTIDRWDVMDDARSLIERDAERYTERMERCLSSANVMEAKAEKQILTMDDLYRVKLGLENQCYDAFVLYAEEDMDFVEEMIRVLECERRLKLCLKDRDLMGGITFEHEAIMQLISERCNRLIVVISPDFQKSPANAFFLNYAQAVGIGTGQRKIIPCLYKKCQLPPQLAYQFILDYGKKGLYDFWARLDACVRPIGQKDDGVSESRLSKQQPPVVGPDEKESVKDESMTSEVPCSAIVDEKSMKSKKDKRFIVWPRKKREKKKLRVPKPPTESVTITLSLPSLDGLPSLDTDDGGKSSKRKKNNLVGTCINKMQTLLTK